MIADLRTTIIGLMILVSMITSGLADAAWWHDPCRNLHAAEKLRHSRSASNKMAIVRHQLKMSTDSMNASSIRLHHLYGVPEDSVPHSRNTTIRKIDKSINRIKENDTRDGKLAITFRIAQHYAGILEKLSLMRLNTTGTFKQKSEREKILKQLKTSYKAFLCNIQDSIKNKTLIKMVPLERMVIPIPTTATATNMMHVDLKMVEKVMMFMVRLKTKHVFIKNRRNRRRHKESRMKNKKPRPVRVI